MNTEKNFPFFFLSIGKMELDDGDDRQHFEKLILFCFKFCRIWRYLMGELENWRREKEKVSQFIFFCYFPDWSLAIVSTLP